MLEPPQFNTDRTDPGRWTGTFGNPPIVELGALMTDTEADPPAESGMFQSVNPDSFIAHLDISKATERPGAPSL